MKIKKHLKWFLFGTIALGANTVSADCTLEWSPSQMSTWGYTVYDDYAYTIIVEEYGGSGYQLEEFFYDTNGNGLYDTMTRIVWAIAGGELTGHMYENISMDLCELTGSN